MQQARQQPQWAGEDGEEGVPLIETTAPSSAHYYYGGNTNNKTTAAEGGSKVKDTVNGVKNEIGDNSPSSGGGGSPLRTTQRRGERGRGRGIDSNSGVVPSRIKAHLFAEKTFRGDDEGVPLSDAEQDDDNEEGGTNGTSNSNDQGNSTTSHSNSSAGKSKVKSAKNNHNNDNNSNSTHTTVAPKKIRTKLAKKPVASKVASSSGSDDDDDFYIKSSSALLPPNQNRASSKTSDVGRGRRGASSRFSLADDHQTTAKKGNTNNNNSDNNNKKKEQRASSSAGGEGGAGVEEESSAVAGLIAIVAALRAKEKEKKLKEKEKKTHTSKRSGSNTTNNDDANAEEKALMNASSASIASSSSASTVAYVPRQTSFRTRRRQEKAGIATDYRFPTRGDSVFFASNTSTNDLFASSVDRRGSAGNNANKSEVNDNNRSINYLMSPLAVAPSRSASTFVGGSSGGGGGGGHTMGIGFTTTGTVSSRSSCALVFNSRSASGVGGGAGTTYGGSGVALGSSSSVRVSHTVVSFLSPPSPPPLTPGAYQQQQKNKKAPSSSVVSSSSVDFTVADSSEIGGGDETTNTREKRKEQYNNGSDDDEDEKRGSEDSRTVSDTSTALTDESITRDTDNDIDDTGEILVLGDSPSSSMSPSERTGNSYYYSNGDNPLLSTNGSSSVTTAASSSTTTAATTATDDTVSTVVPPLAGALRVRRLGKEAEGHTKSLSRSRSDLLSAYRARENTGERRQTGRGAEEEERTDLPFPFRRRGDADKRSVTEIFGNANDDNEHVVHHDDFNTIPLVCIIAAGDGRDLTGPMSVENEEKLSSPAVTPLLPLSPSPPRGERKSAAAATPAFAGHGGGGGGGGRVLLSHGHTPPTRTTSDSEELHTDNRGKGNKKGIRPVAMLSALLSTNDEDDNEEQQQRKQKDSEMVSAHDTCNVGESEPNAPDALDVSGFSAGHSIKSPSYLRAAETKKDTTNPSRGSSSTTKRAPKGVGNNNGVINNNNKGTGDNDDDAPCPRPIPTFAPIMTSPSSPSSLSDDSLSDDDDDGTIIKKKDDDGDSSANNTNSTNRSEGLRSPPQRAHANKITSVGPPTTAIMGRGKATAEELRKERHHTNNNNTNNNTTHTKVTIVSPPPSQVKSGRSPVKNGRPGGGGGGAKVSPTSSPARGGKGGGGGEVNARVLLDTVNQSAISSPSFTSFPTPPASPCPLRPAAVVVRGGGAHTRTEGADNDSSSSSGRKETDHPLLVNNNKVVVNVASIDPLSSSVSSHSSASSPNLPTSPTGGAATKHNAGQRGTGNLFLQQKKPSPDSTPASARGHPPAVSKDSSGGGLSHTARTNKDFLASTAIVHSMSSNRQAGKSNSKQHTTSKQCHPHNGGGGGESHLTVNTNDNDNSFLAHSAPPTDDFYPPPPLHPPTGLTSPRARHHVVQLTSPSSSFLAVASNPTNSPLVLSPAAPSSSLSPSSSSAVSPSNGCANNNASVAGSANRRSPRLARSLVACGVQGSADAKVEKARQEEGGGGGADAPTITLTGVQGSMTGGGVDATREATDDGLVFSPPVPLSAPLSGSSVPRGSVPTVMAPQLPDIKIKSVFA